MRLAFAALLMAALSAIPSTGNAKLISTLDLHRVCSARMGQTSFIIDYASCLGYISGVADAVDETRISRGKRACVPDGMRDFEVKNIVVGYIARNPDKWHLPASAIVAEALKNDMPDCKG